ncbi:MAG: PAS domain S-box protein [Deltaproteobacteria bacterium]|nr:PAS domain S-box protein [Deltaproteobacteria bacterium]MBZ0219626.1 PAS domain S-box protein [Deltaproteobacteria bacterium]
MEEKTSRQGRPEQKTEARTYSPMKIILILVLSVFFVEILIMLLLYFYRDFLEPVHAIFIDAPLLVLILSPILYYFIFRPLIALVEKRAEAERAASRERDRFQKYLEVAGVMVVVLDRDGKVRLINRNACQALGYREEEVLGRDWVENFIPARLRKEVRFEFDGLISAGREAEGYFENPVMTRSGEERDVLWHNAVLMEDGVVAGTLSSGEDITERKKTELALKESETRYRLVHNTAFDGIIIADAKDRIIDCNESAARIFGYPREGLIGQDVSVIVPDKYKKAHKEGLERFLKTGESTVQGMILEYEGVRKNGEIFPLELALNNFTLGGVLHFTAMVRDITDRKRAERERELIQARLSQSQKMEAIGRFAGGISHDFNNILTAIRGNAELALEEMKKTDPAYPRVDGIINSVMLASKLTRQLLLFSRGQPFELVPLNINKLVEELLVMISHIIGEDITISTDLAPDLWTIEADESNIEQVIMNLALNAKDAMPEGGTLSIKTENVVIDERRAKAVPDARQGEAVCLTVADTGVGIEREFLPRIFEPFFTTKEAGKGTGFGLSIVYSIVKQHRGWLSVKSEPGKGTMFRIYFPAVLRRREREEAREGKHLKGRGEKVLLVEDDLPVREFTKAALANNGFRVVEAGNAKEAIEAFEREPDLKLLFSDLVLKDKSGFNLAEEVLTRKPDMAVVITSGYAEETTRPLLKEKGYSFLPKPYSVSSLMRAVSEALERSKRSD